MDGLWECITIDDQIPCDLSYNEISPLYNKTRKNDCELWVVLLEKAWAKIFRGYQNIDGGFMTEPLRDLTGASTEAFYTSGTEEEEFDEEFLWKKVLETSEKNWITCASTFNTENGDEYDQNVGICYSHAYSLLDGIEIYEYEGRYYKNHAKGKRIRLLKMRNPHGTNESVMEWGDQDIRWKSKDL